MCQAIWAPAQVRKREDWPGRPFGILGSEAPGLAGPWAAAPCAGTPHSPPADPSSPPPSPRRVRGAPRRPPTVA
eukprot:2551653-Pyramimonas_sp.AAC.1